MAKLHGFIPRLVVSIACGCCIFSVVILFATACGGENGAATQEQAAPTTTATEQTTTEATTVEEESPPTEEAPLLDVAQPHPDGGRYRTRLFRPAFTIDFGKTGFIRQREGENHVLFLIGDLQQRYLSFFNDEVVLADPNIEINQEVPPADPNAAGVEPAAWLQEHPRLQTSPERSVKLNGLSATQFDVVVRPDQAYTTETGCQGLSCVVIFGISGGAYVLPVDNRLRVLALDAGGQQLLVAIEAPKGDFTRWTKSAEKILSTLTLKRGG